MVTPLMHMRLPMQVWVLDTLPGDVRSGDMGGADRPADLITLLQQARGGCNRCMVCWLGAGEAVGPVNRWRVLQAHMCVLCDGQ